MPKKLTYSFVKNSFEKEGYTLISKEYVNNHTKLEYICPEGHKHSIIWRNWQRGDRCPYCAGQAKPSLSFIKYTFKKEGYVLLSKEYVNNHTKLDYICPKGHRHSMTWSSWNKGVRCVYCSTTVRPSLEKIKQSFEKEGYTLLSTKYINNKTKLKYKCKYGHQHYITWGNWITGFRCPTCKGIKQSINRAGAKHPNWRGGISKETYCSLWTDKEYKQDIKDRDGNKCLNPYCYKTDNILTIHHIDYNKKNCKPNNLITVCRACNSRANKDRAWHKAWYQAIIYRRYGNINNV